MARRVTAVPRKGPFGATAPQGANGETEKSVDRAHKEELVGSLNQTFAQSSMVVVTHYIGLSVNEMETLRGQVRDAGAQFKVTKNRLTRLALKGTPYENLDDLFTGPTAVAFSDDPVAAAKATVEFSKKNEKLVILGGAMGTQRLDADAVKSLASLPSLDELRAKMLALLNTPAQRLATLTQEPGAQIARVLAARGEQQDAA